MGGLGRFWGWDTERNKFIFMSNELNKKKRRYINHLEPKTTKIAREREGEIIKVKTGTA